MNKKAFVVLLVVVILSVWAAGTFVDGFQKKKMADCSEIRAAANPANHCP